MTQKANEKQHGGSHYKDLAIQPWDYILANDIPYLEGNVIKYVSRWKDKGGVEDLKKAQHYLEKLIEANTDLHPNKIDEAVAEPVYTLYVEIEGGCLTGIYGEPLPTDCQIEFVPRDMDMISTGDPDTLVHPKDSLVKYW